MGQIFIFIAFLVTYVLYLGLTYFLIMKYVSDPKKERFFLNELIIVIPNLFLFALLFIIGQFFSWYLPLASIALSNIGLLLSFIIWNLLGSPKVPFKSIGGWAGYNFGIKNAWFFLSSQFLSIIILLAYPVVVGIHFFGDPSVDQIRIFTLQCTIILILSSYLLLIPTNVNILGANFIDEDTRARYLITQFSGLIPNALFISLLLWTFREDKTSKKVSSGMLSTDFDPLIFFILLAFFALFFLLPYFIGIQKTKQLKSEYFDNKTAVLDHVIEAIDLSNIKNIIPRIEESEQFLKSKYCELVEDNKVLSLGISWDGQQTSADLNKNEALIFGFYKDARPFDKRFIYYDFLNNIYNKLFELKESVEAELIDQNKRELLKSYSLNFKEFKQDIIEINDKKSSSNPALWLAIIGIASPFVSQILTESGKHLIEYFQKL